MAGYVVRQFPCRKDSHPCGGL